MTGPLMLLAVGNADTQLPVTSFGNEPFWLTVAKALFVFVLLVLLTLFAIVFERKVVSYMQQRVGPNRVGPRGYLQSLADGLKLALKEEIIPALANKPVYILAPILSAVPAFLAFSVIPFGPKVSIGGHETALQLTDLPVGVLFLLACSSLGVFGIVLAGWSSGSTYPLLGGLRSAAQVISYEIAMGLSLVAVFLYSGSLATSEIVAAQESRWFIVTLPISFLIYVVAMVGETNRAPFDLPEAESELVGGLPHRVHLAEVRHVLPGRVHQHDHRLGAGRDAVPGWLASAARSWVGSMCSARAGSRWCGSCSRSSMFIFCFVWLRGTLPRMRYDQFMKLGWKVLVPLSLFWILLVATIRTASLEVENRSRCSVIVAVVFFVVLAGLYMLPQPAAPESHGRGIRSRPLAVRGRWLPDPAAGPRRPANAPVAGQCFPHRIHRPRPPSRRPTVASFLDPVKGFGLTFTTMFKTKTTEQYPEEITGTAPRYHGRHVLNRHPDGLEKCIGCELCAWACPADAIYVEGADNSDSARFSPGERYAAVYQINYLRCIFCGLCIEACPTRSLTMTNEYELADDSRQSLIFTKEQLLAPLLQGMEQPPHPMRLGTDADYYAGTGNDPLREGS